MLVVKLLTKVFTLYGLGKKILGFANVSFTVAPGQFLAIAGPSGSGKSSVLKCIHRTYLATSGQIFYASSGGWVELTRLSDQAVLSLRKQEIAYVSQFLRILPRVTALEAVMEPLLTVGVDRETALAQVQQLFISLHIPESLWDAYPTTFSGGEQQRINIARALIRHPRLLLLDEPTASLDKDSEERVFHLLRRLKEAGTTLLGIFHNLRAVESMADQVYYMPSKEKEDVLL